MTARLLVVDDEPRTAELTAELLRRAGYVVEVAASGSEALQSVRSSSPDLMLLDYEMPDMEAPEVLDSLRSGADRIAFPVIILTGVRHASGDQVLGIDHGATDYIVKGTDRQVLLARIRGALRQSAPEARVVVAGRLRPDARQTVAFFAAEGVALAVLSGDRPETGASIAAEAGIETSTPIDGGALPEDPDELRRLVLEHRVVGRITPQGKRRVVEALRDGGRYVAMIGDGINDVPALKAARLAIAQGSGAQMARSVSDLVLVRGDFAALPAMVGEGRKILRNLQRVAKLFVTKSVFAVFLILSIGLTPTAYPLLPRQLTLAAAITIGLPSIFLALAPSTGTFRTRGFLREVARFAVPAGTAAGLGVLSGYLLALNVANVPLEEARTVATTVLVAIGLYLILALEAAGRRRGTAISILCGALAALYLVVLAVPGSRSFFALHGLGVGGWIAVLVGSGLAIGFLWITDDRFVPGRLAV